VHHDVGANINYTIIARKANAVDNFSATTVIHTGTAASVASGVGTKITLTIPNMGDCSNGIEIEVKADCGVVTAKNFRTTEWQLEESSVTSFERKSYQQEKTACQRFYEKTYDDGTAPGTATQNGAISCATQATNQACSFMWPFKVSKRAAPTCRAYSTSSGTIDKVWGNVAGDTTPILSNIGENGIYAYASFVSIQTGYAQFTADAEL
jgi:hypothetical protein